MSGEQSRAYRETVYPVTDQDQVNCPLSDALLLSLVHEHGLDIKAIGSNLHIIHPDAKPLPSEVRQFCKQWRFRLWQLAQEHKGGTQS